MDEHSVFYRYFLRSARTMSAAMLLMVGGLLLAVDLCGRARPGSRPLSILLLLAGALCAAYEALARRRKAEILRSGVFVTGKVTRVSCERGIGLKTRAGQAGETMPLHPYTVYFTYTVDGAVHYAQSDWHWSPPACVAGDALRVFYDKARPAAWALEQL